jgi:hypothetical protein
MLRVTSSPDHQMSRYAQTHGGISPSSPLGLYGVGLVSSPHEHEHRQRPVRTNNSRIASPVAVSVDAGYVIIHVPGTPLVLLRRKKLSTWGQKVWRGGYCIEEKSTALRPMPISESQSARIELSSDECMHEMMDGSEDERSTVGGHRACAGCLEQGGPCSSIAASAVQDTRTEERK